MKYRTAIIFSIFIALTIVGGIFIFFYRDFANELVLRYISKISICGNITNEQICFEKPFCEGIYGPSCPDCDDLEFKTCRRIPAEALLKAEKDKKLCEETGGMWYQNELGSSCICQKAGPNKTFDKKLGCINK